MRTLDQIKLKPNERAAIQAAAAVLREHLPVTQVILFGSKARGDDDAESDIDLLVLTDRKLSWKERTGVIDLLLPLELQHDVCFGSTEVWEHDWRYGVYQVLPLHAEVERDGVAA